MADHAALRFAAIGLDHRHIHHQVRRLLELRAECTGQDAPMRCPARFLSGAFPTCRGWRTCGRCSKPEDPADRHHRDPLRPAAPIPWRFRTTHNRELLADLLDGIDQNRSPRVTGREARRTRRFIDAVLGAAAEGRIVRVLTD